MLQKISRTQISSGMYKALNYLECLSENQLRAYYSLDGDFFEIWGHRIPYEMFHDYAAIRRSQRLMIEPNQEEEKSMKTRNAAILLNDTITTIKVKFIGKNNTPNDSDYSFLCKKELANELKIDDLVVVKASTGFAVVKVVEVHEEADIDLDSLYKYNWCFQKVNVVLFEQLDALLNDAEKHIKSMQRSALRNQIRQHIEQGKLLEGTSTVKFEEDEDD